MFLFHVGSRCENVLGLLILVLQASSRMAMLDSAACSVAGMFCPGVSMISILFDLLLLISVPLSNLVYMFVFVRGTYQFLDPWFFPQHSFCYPCLSNLM